MHCDRSLHNLCCSYWRSKVILGQLTVQVQHDPNKQLFSNKRTDSVSSSKCCFLPSLRSVFTNPACAVFIYQFGFLNWTLNRSGDTTWPIDVFNFICQIQIRVSWVLLSADSRFGVTEEGDSRCESSWNLCLFYLFFGFVFQGCDFILCCIVFLSLFSRKDIIDIKKITPTSLLSLPQLDFLNQSFCIVLQLKSKKLNLPEKQCCTSLEKKSWFVILTHLF